MAESVAWAGRRRGPRSRLVLAAAFSAFCVTVFLAAPARAEPSFKFASAAEGKALLGARDEYVEAMSPFDRAVRLRARDRDVSEAEYLALVTEGVLEWEGQETRTIGCALRRIGPALSRLFPPLREPIWLVKTKGQEEFGAAYTRGNAIVLPTTALRPMLGSQWILRRTLAHEFFHIFSRNNPKLRSALYEAIGFRHCGKVELPVVLRTRMITNPDAPRNEHCIRVQLSGKPVWAVPILHPPRFEEATGFDLNTLLLPSLLLVEKDSVSGVARPIVGADGPLLVDIGRVTGLFEQIGRNTSYIIHPEEILAENASLLTLGARHFPSPEILNKIEGLLREARVGDPGPGEDGGKVAPAPDRDCADVR